MCNGVQAAAIGSERRCRAADWLFDLQNRRRRLAHVLPWMGQTALRPQRRRPDGPRPASFAGLARRWRVARPRGLRSLAAIASGGLAYPATHSNAPTASWIPLWFGNQDDPREENPIYGTAKVLVTAYRDLPAGRGKLQERSRGVAIAGGHESRQRSDGSWGGVATQSAAAWRKRLWRSRLLARLG